MKERSLRRKDINIGKAEESTWIKLVLGRKLYAHRKMVGASILSFFVSLLMFLNVIGNGYIEAKGAKIGGLVVYGIVGFFTIIFVFLVVGTFKEWKGPGNV
ncbi:hypothetical protein [Microbulbifer rhizosphaerae]|uniref:Uncharacterized protein n=1 Tax=Microbulbifer rhizosphaerae TaxID=1562603 RepID=A0A7W4WFJ8_9GAMM|nr:hypothetical protein [Microbulbifer rhizosphaerae]MBB3063286.1 hypothetical protein [Microbulbifer rhizosphaerae]